MSKGQPTPRADTPISVIFLQEDTFNSLSRQQLSPRADRPISVIPSQFESLILLRAIPYPISGRLTASLTLRA